MLKVCNARVVKMATVQAIGKATLYWGSSLDVLATVPVPPLVVWTLNSRLHDPAAGLRE